LLDFVRQRGSQLSHAAYPIGACEIRLRLPQRLFRLLPLCDLRLEVVSFTFELTPKPIHLFECAGVCDSDRSLIRKQTEPSEFLLRKTFTAENPNDSQQIVSKD
jgi:hypothetical protein